MTGSDPITGRWRERLGASRWACLFLPLGLLLTAGDAAAAAAEGASGPSEALFLAELMILIVSGRLLGEAMLRIGQPSVMGQLIAGILLGPSVFGWLWPDLQHLIFPAAKDQRSMIDAVSQFGILLLLMLTGMETDLKLVSKVGRSALSVSLVGVALPFLCGLGLGEFLPESLLPDPGKRTLTALFLGTALSISSIKIVAAIVREMNFTRRNLGQVIVASAIIEDTIGWIIIAITFGLAEAGTIDLYHVGKSVIGTAAFLAASFTFGRRIVFWLIRWANDHFESDFPVITMILAIMGAMALTTHLIGVHTVLGAFVSGVLVGESPILSRHIDEQLRGLILAFFMPVFFGMAGLSADLTVLRDPSLLLMTVALVLIASLGKFAGAFVGGKVGGLTGSESLALGCAMNARGSTEVIVATIGLSMGALSQNLFSMIVAMAVTTTMAMPPMLRWALRRVPLRKSEKERLEHEEMEGKGFVPNLERLLLAIDDSPAGKLASRLASLLAAPRGIPVTVLPLSGSNNKPKRMPEREKAAAATGDAAAADAVKVAAEDTRKTQPEEAAAKVDLTVRKIEASTSEAIAKEAKKGYDLLFIGAGNTRAPGGAFHQDVNRIAAAFEGPLAVVAPNGSLRKDPARGPFKILVPLNGTDVSRRGAEVAIAIARAANAPITALYVSNPKPGPRARRSNRLRVRPQEAAILRDAVDLADQYDQEVKIAVQSAVAPDQAVLREAARGGHNLIIMGVSRRPGTGLFFGDTAAGIFEDSPNSIVFVAS
jgi:Kef-type K+ transport system membrane component KefB/nucleotide-binding universal stress UspA family protein